MPMFLLEDEATLDVIRSLAYNTDISIQFQLINLVQHLSEFRNHNERSSSSLLIKKEQVSSN